MHLDGLDLPQVKKTLININGINTDIITMPLEAITAGAASVGQHAAVSAPSAGLQVTVSPESKALEGV